MKNFFPVCYSSSLKSKPLAVELYNHPIVLFRDKEGVAQALENRCPHRGAPLSEGSVENGCIRCPYHGWTFCESGKCVSLPGSKNNLIGKIYDVPAYKTSERYGLIWVALEEGLPLVDISELEDKSYSHFEMFAEVNVPLADAAENLLDPMHTHYVHDKWIRSEGKRSAKKVILTVSSNSIEAEYINESYDNGFIQKCLTLGRTVTKTYGRFIGPNTAELEYRTNVDDHFLITAFFSPEKIDKTKLFLIVSCKSTFPFFLVKWLVKMLFAVALKQDREILQMVGNHRNRFKESGKKISASSDLLGPYIDQLVEGKSLQECIKERTIYV